MVKNLRILRFGFGGGGGGGGVAAGGGGGVRGTSFAGIVEIDGVVEVGVTGVVDVTEGGGGG